MAEQINDPVGTDPKQSVTRRAAMSGDTAANAAAITTINAFISTTLPATYETVAHAAATYQTITGMSSYVLKSAIDTDGTLAANSDTVLASQKAVKTYVDAAVSGGGGGGGGGGGVTMFYETFGRIGSVGSSTSFATKGIYITPFEDITLLDALFAAFGVVAGQKYRARVYEVSGTGALDTITAIVDAGVEITIPTTVGFTLLSLPFTSSPVTLLAGHIYMLAISRTDSTGTATNPIWAATAGNPISTFVAADVAQLRAQLTSTAPAVGTVVAPTSGGGFNIQVLVDRT